MSTTARNLGSDAGGEDEPLPALGNGKVVVEMTAPTAAGPASEREERSLGAPGREPLGRFRRRLDRIKGLPDPDIVAGAPTDEAELRLELMLLREENARLKSARHRPASTGTAIDRVRMLTDADGDTVDDAVAILSECLAIREGLEQTCTEVQAAMEAVRRRLALLTEGIAGAAADELPGADATSSFSA